MPGPVAGADALGERRHAAKDAVHLGDDIVPVDDDRPPRGCAQRDMQHGSVLGDVDPLAREHGLDPRPQA
jgi:hypothetical protein